MTTTHDHKNICSSFIQKFEDRNNFSWVDETKEFYYPRFLWFHESDHNHFHMMISWKNEEKFRNCWMKLNSSFLFLFWHFPCFCQCFIFSHLIVKNVSSASGIMTWHANPMSFILSSKHSLICCRWLWTSCCTK